MMWNSDYSFGALNLGISFWPILTFAGLLSQLNLPPYLIERIIFLWPITILLPVGAYSLSYYLFRSQIASAVGSLYFQFNTYLIILQGGHLTLLMAIILTPFYLLFFILTLAKNKLFFAMITALIGFVMSFYEFRIFYLATWMVFFYLIYQLFILREFTGLKDFIIKVALSASIVLIVFLLNLYSLLGISGAESLTDIALFNRSLFGAWYIKLIKIMTIFHFGWTGGKIEPWKIQPLMGRFLLIPIIVFTGFIVGKKNNKLPFFAFLALLGIFLAKQNTPPFPDIYQWLFDHIPGFNAFRESGKFLLFVVISYSMLISAFISWLWKDPVHKLNKKKPPRIVGGAVQAKQRANQFSETGTWLIRTVITIVIALLFIWNAKPIITGELGSLFVPRTVPQDYLILKNHLLRDRDFYRTLWSPNYSRWGHYLSNHPRTSMLYLNLYEWLDFAKKGNPIGSNYFNQLLDISSIKYVLVPLQDKNNDDDFFPQTIKRSSYISELEKLPYLNTVNIGMREVVIFENYDYRPHIYATRKMESVFSYVPYQKAAYHMRNPTEYRINLNNIRGRIFLNFSENFHPSWKLKVGKFQWYEALVQKYYFLSDKLHFKNEAGFNTFYLDPVTICQTEKNGCLKNSDGSYDINLTLFFRPQAYVYLGFIVSGLTLCLILLYLTGIGVKQVWNGSSRLKRIL